MALQGRGLGVESTDQDHVAVEAVQRRAGEIDEPRRVGREVAAVACGGARLDVVVIRFSDWGDRLGGVGSDHTELLLVGMACAAATYASVGYGAVGRCARDAITSVVVVCRKPPTLRR